MYCGEWGNISSMKISEFSKYLSRLEIATKRLEITDILAEFLKKSSSSEVGKALYLMLGILAPSYTGLVFNLAERMMIRIVAKAYNQSEEGVKEEYKKSGDLGKVAEKLAREEKTRAKGVSSVGEVYDALLKVANEEGKDSQERKINGMAKIMRSLDPLSARYVARIPVGKLRLGFSEKTVIDALSIMEVGDKSLKGDLERSFNIYPDIGKLAQDIKVKGVKRALSSISPHVEVPVAPMLAARLKSPEDMIAKMGLVSVEPKYDGLRIFIHYRKAGYPKKGTPEYIRIYTRNMNFIENGVFPELANVGKYIKANEAILDTEAVGMDPKRSRLVDFQTTMQRRRKHEVTKAAEDIPLQFQVFDILLKDGESLLAKPYTERRKVLDKTVVSGKLLRVDEHTLTKDPDEIRKLHKHFLDKGLEGIIVKKADSHYVSGRTGWRWVKMKEVESARGKLADTVDAVVMGYTRGRGKRAEFGIGQFLAGVLDGDMIKTVTKVGTGLTDEQFRELNTRLSKIKVQDMPKVYSVHKDLYPDYWVNPQVVVELAADEITKSPKHTAGFALRFPRLISFRDDKGVPDATTISEIKKLFTIQKS